MDLAATRVSPVHGRIAELGVPEEFQPPCAVPAKGPARAGSHGNPLRDLGGDFRRGLNHRRWPMNNERTVWHVGVAFFIACFLFAGIVAKVKLSTPVPAINADRAAVRAKALAEIRVAEDQALNHAGWIDESRGLMRLPIDVAMQITERVGQDPAAV